MVDCTVAVSACAAKSALYNESGEAKLAENRTRNVILFSYVECQGTPPRTCPLHYPNTHKHSYLEVCVAIQCVNELLSDGNRSDHTVRGLTSCPLAH